MKVTRDARFSPVTIVLENEKEAMVLWDSVNNNATEVYKRSASKRRGMTIEEFDRIHYEIFCNIDELISFGD